jgi:hypothetical protein
VIAQTRPDLFEMVGVSETEVVDDLQQALHTVENMRFDNLHLTVMRGITYREGGVTDPNMLELRPRFKWPVSDHDDIRPFEVQPLPPEAYEEENALLARMQLITGINPYISGADLQSVDQNTATGVTALQEVASRLLRFKAGRSSTRATSGRSSSGVRTRSSSWTGSWRSRSPVRGTTRNGSRLARRTSPAI